MYYFIQLPVVAYLCHKQRYSMTIKDANTFNDQDENVEGAEGAEELFERFSLVVDRGQEPMRLDKFLVARIEGASRNKVQQSIESGRVTVNGKSVQANHKIKPGEEIIVYSDKEMHGEEIIPEQMPLTLCLTTSSILVKARGSGLLAGVRTCRL